MKIRQILLSIVVISLVSCGGGDSPKKHNATPAKSMVETEETAEPVAEKEGVINIAGNDAMKFDKTELRATAGEEVTVVLTHTGELPKAAMGHNFVLLKQGTELEAFATKAMTAVDNDYIPEGDEVIAHTKTIGGGETTSVTFIAPAAGTYLYLCSFPGHYAMMNGKFIVE